MVASNRRKIRAREGACQPIHTMNLQYMAMIKDSQLVGCTLSEIYSQITSTNIKLKSRLSVHLHFWNAHNLVVSASIETGLAQNESCAFEEH